MRAVVNFSNNSYTRGQKRLKQTLNDSWPIYFYNEYDQIGSPDHFDNPYAFKLYAIEKARESGATSILYLDASVYPVKDITTLFEMIEKDGYLMQEAGHFVGRWSNDRCLEYFGITREEANKMLMYGNAGLLGLDFTSEIAKDFFNKWMEACKDGIFKGSWIDHRHDMTVGSIIANNLNMKYHSGDEILAYASPEEEVSEKIILKAQGL